MVERQKLFGDGPDLPAGRLDAIAEDVNTDGLGSLWHLASYLRLILGVASWLISLIILARRTVVPLPLESNAIRQFAN